MIEFERREAALEQEAAHLATRIEALGMLAKASGWAHTKDIPPTAWAYNPGSWMLEDGSLWGPNITFKPLVHAELIQAGMPIADFRVTIPRNMPDIDARGSMFGDFFINKSGGIIKTLSVPPDEIRDEDIVLDFPQFDGWKIIIDEEALNRENVGGNIEAVGYLVDRFTKQIVTFAQSL